MGVEVGATVMWEPGQGLNGAVRRASTRLAKAGARWVTVAHGDLPMHRGWACWPRSRRHARP